MFPRGVVGCLTLTGAIERRAHRMLDDAMRMEKRRWERLLFAFIDVALVVRFASPRLGLGSP